MTTHSRAVAYRCEVVCPGSALLTQAKRKVGKRIPADISAVEEAVFIFFHDHAILSG